MDGLGVPDSPPPVRYGVAAGVRIVAGRGMLCWGTAGVGQMGRVGVGVLLPASGDVPMPGWLYSMAASCVASSLAENVG